MFISRVHSKGKDGRQYVSVLLRQSKHVGKSVVSKALAILTELPDWPIAVVERAVKHGHLEIRPWYVITEDNTRAHALTAMLALKIRRRLQSAWEPLNLTVEEGLAELSNLCVMELYETATGQTVSRQIPDPTVGQASLLAALGVELPEKAPPAGPVVVTRVESTLQVSKLINNPRVWKDR